MKVFQDLKHSRSALQHSTIAIGNFDGVHLGHLAIFEQLRRLAHASHTESVILTFEPHPVRYFNPQAEPFRLTTQAQKLDLFRQYHLDAAMVLPFTRDVAEMPAKVFIDTVLCQGLKARHIAIGPDFRFGRRREGNVEMLRQEGITRGFGVSICPPVELDGAVVSSTRIREAVRSGDFEQATRLLGRPYRIAGTVVHGDARGRTLGYPTANISTPNALFPPDGIYATTLHTSGLPPLQSATYVGKRPTFGGDNRQVEVFVLPAEVEKLERATSKHHVEGHAATDRAEPEDTSAPSSSPNPPALASQLDLYGAKVDLDFWWMVRPDRAFADSDALVEQMHRDVRAVQDYFHIGN